MFDLHLHLIQGIAEHTEYESEVFCNICIIYFNISFPFCGRQNPNMGSKKNFISEQTKACFYTLLPKDTEKRTNMMQFTRQLVLTTREAVATALLDSA